MRTKVYSANEQMYRDAKAATERGETVIVTFADGCREVVSSFRKRDGENAIETLRGWTHKFTSFASFEKVTDAQKFLYPEPKKKAA